METLSILEKSTRTGTFLNFLRGMETGPRPPRGPVSTGFLNFLRGMETIPVVGDSLHPADFLNFLRGMETISRIRVDAVVDCTFLNFLRGMETHDSPLGAALCIILPKLP